MCGRRGEAEEKQTEGRKEKKIEVTGNAPKSDSCGGGIGQGGRQEAAVLLAVLEIG